MKFLNRNKRWSRINHVNDSQGKSTLLVIKLGAAMFLVILLFGVWIVNRLVTYGDKMNEIKQSQQSLRLENQILENKIAKNSSLIVAEGKSAYLGFLHPKNFEYIKNQ